VAKNTATKNVTNMSHIPTSLIKDPHKGEGNPYNKEQTTEEHGEGYPIVAGHGLGDAPPKVLWSTWTANDQPIMEVNAVV